MNKKLLVAAAGAVSALSLFVASPSQAACNDGGAWAKKSDGTPSNTDTIATAPNGTTLYTNGSSYAGVRGNTGYIEWDGNSLDGQTNDGKVHGSAGTGGVCVNDLP